MSERAKHRFASDDALDRGYLRRKGPEGVPYTLSLLRSYLGLEFQQDCAIFRIALMSLFREYVTYVVNGHDGFWEGTKGRVIRSHESSEVYLSKHC